MSFSSIPTLHDAFLRGDATARQQVQALQSQANRNPQAALVLQALAFHHDRSRQLGVRGPGQARIGGYGMPSYHPAGITVGARSLPSISSDHAHHILTLIQAARRPAPAIRPQLPRISGCGGYPYPSPALASWAPPYASYGLPAQGYPFAVAYQSPLACYRAIPGGIQYM